MTKTITADLCVIGAGSAGLSLSAMTGVIVPYPTRAEISKPENP